MKQKAKTILTVVILVIAVIYKFYNTADEHSVPERDGSITAPESGAFADKFTPVKTRRERINSASTSWILPKVNSKATETAKVMASASTNRLITSE